MTYQTKRNALRIMLLAGIAVAAGTQAQAQTALTGQSPQSYQLPTSHGIIAPSTIATPPGTSADGTGNFFQKMMTRQTMTGTWNGGRTRLKEAGITFTGSYVGEFADALSGGKRQGNGYAQQLGVSANADMGKLFGLDGGTLHFAFNQRQGRNASTDFIGNKLSVQEVYGAGETLRVVEMSYEQEWANKLVDTKIGFFPMGNEFAATPALCAFQNVGFCAHPQNLPGSSGWSDNPTGKWGGEIVLNVQKNLYIETGAFDVNPTYPTRENGLKVSTSGSTGALIPVELGYTSALGEEKLPGHYKVGAYWDTSDVADVTNAKEIDDGRYGYYLLTDQMLFSFDGGNKRGLTAFGQVSFSDPRTALFQGTVVGALIAKGVFAERPADYFDAGYVRAIINGRAVDVKEAESKGTLTDLSTGEGVVEFGYGFQATPWLVLHPNAQYIMDPGTFSYTKKYANAWVFGFQVKAIL